MYFTNKLVTRFSMCVLSTAMVGTASAETVLEEVLVTAQKRAESVADIPISITAVSAEALDFDNIKNVAELSSQVPGLVVAKNEGYSRAVSIRGIGFETTQNVIGIPSVAFHIDGVFIADANALNLDFIDVERVEILRGPQGTLFGQNSTGGAINVVNNRPNLEEFGGHADLALGNYGLVQPRVTVNVPLGDTVAIRTSASYLKHDGFAEISSGSLDGYDLDEEDNSQFQAKLLWQPSDVFSAIISATTFKVDNVHDRAQRHISDPSGDERKLTQDTAGTIDIETKLYSLTLEWDTSFGTIKTITGYLENDLDNFLDNDRGANSFLGLGSQDISFSTRETETFTQEINLVSNNEGKLEWVVGGFYMDFDNSVFFDEFIDFNQDGIADVNDPSERAFTVTTDATRESWSIYGQGTYSFTDDFRLTLGLRYTDDEFKSDVCAFFCAEPSMPEAQEDKTTGKIGVDWDINDDMMLYASYTLGFKPGGNNLNFASVIVPSVYASEEVDAYEIGFKGLFLDSKLQAYAAVFYYEYENMQFLTEDPAAFNGGVDNAPKSEVTGFELELTALLTDSLTLGVDFSFLDTEFTDDHLALDPVDSAALVGEIFGAGGNPFNPFDQIGIDIRADALQNINGNPLPKAPEFSTNISLTHNADISLGQLTSRLSYTYRDEYASRVFKSGGPVDETPSYELWNLSFHLTPSSYPNLSFSLLVTNLTDEDAVNSRWTNNFGVQSTSEEFVAPRQYIARVAYDF